jgi:hypothetical protein
MVDKETSVLDPSDVAHAIFFLAGATNISGAALPGDKAWCTL